MIDWPKVLLNDDGIRPAGPADACFYCRQRVGEEHKRDCAVITKIVRLRYHIEVDVEVPHCWDKEQIEFHRNLGTWCADNALEEIEKHTSHVIKGNDATECLCNRFHAEFVKVIDDYPKRNLMTPEQVAADDAIRKELQRLPSEGR